MLHLPRTCKSRITKCCTCHEKGVDILDVVHYVERVRLSWLHMKLWSSLWAWDAQQFAFPLTMNPTTLQMLDMLNLSYPVHASYIFVTSSITCCPLLLSNSMVRLRFACISLLCNFPRSLKSKNHSFSDRHPVRVSAATGFKKWGVFAFHLLWLTGGHFAWDLISKQLGTKRSN